jgi:predicted phage terminase large subunit-like protein
MSRAERFALLPHDQQETFWDSLTEEEAEALKYSWREWWARPSQIMPEGYWLYIVLAGRGYGKTRLASEWMLELVKSKKHDWVALIGTDLPNITKLFHSGPSGMQRHCPPEIEYKFTRSPRPEWVLAFEGHSVRISGYSAEDPDSLRGFSGTAAVCDEFAAYRYLEETWDMLLFGLREGENPQVLVTTTPRPIKLLRQLVNDPEAYVVRGSTTENRALNQRAVQTMLDRYGDTTLGRQELDGEILPDAGALFKSGDLEATRVIFRKDDGDVQAQREELLQGLDEVVVAVDPSTKKSARSDACGIVVVGRRGKDYYVIDDQSEKLSPDKWARRAVTLYERYRASFLIIETNQGGDMCESVLRTLSDSVAIKKVHAYRSKLVRAEPVAALMEQHRVHHVGVFQQLEQELCEYDASAGQQSPNRLDAYVYALLHLSGSEGGWALDPLTWEFLRSRG